MPYQPGPPTTHVHNPGTLVIHGKVCHVTICRAMAWPCQSRNTCAWLSSGRRHHASGEPISRTRPFPGVRMTLHPAHFAIDPSAVAVDLQKAPNDPERPHRASTTPEGQKRIRRNSVGP